MHWPLSHEGFRVTNAHIRRKFKLQVKRPFKHNAVKKNDSKIWNMVDNAD
jgi:hypothetical protein